MNQPAQRSEHAQRLIDELTDYVDSCEEAHTLLAFADTLTEPLTWAPGQRLRDVLLDAWRRQQERGE